MVKRKRPYYTAKEVCEMFDISKPTLFKWEKNSLISRTPRDWRGWRKYAENHLVEIKKIIKKRSRRA